MYRGFSLVELSIVLVILGLLVGGVLTGQSLIRAAELRSVTTDLSQWQIAVHHFEEKYSGLPGDLINATEQWGSANGASCAHGSTGVSSGTATCNGNGSGSITYGGSIGAPQYVEMFMFWQHLANAGLIQGKYTGQSDAVHFEHAVIRSNVPGSKVSNSAGWSILADMVIDTGTAGDPNPVAYGTNYRWPLYFGSQHASWEVHEPALTTQDAHSIDTKIDDGVGSRGYVVMDMWYQTTACRNGATPLSYNLQQTGIVCGLIFRQ